MDARRSDLHLLGLSGERSPPPGSSEASYEAWESTVKKAFRALARTHHPDKGGDL